MDIEIETDEVNKFADLFVFKSFKKGDYIIRAGDSFNLIGFVNKGLVRFYFDTFEGKEFNQTFKKEGDFIMNYYPLYNNTGSPFSIQAMEDTTIFIADYQDFLPFYDRHPIWDRLGRKLAEANFMIKSRREAQ